LKPTVIALAALLAGSGPAASQSLYKCVVDGKTSYQSEPCGGKAAQSELRAPAPRAPAPEPAKAEEAKPAADAKPKAASRVTRDEMDLVIDTFAGYTICAENDPGFAAKIEAAFEGWRMRNAALLDRFNQDPEGQALLQQRLQTERQRQQGDRDVARSARIEACVRTATRVRPVKPEGQ
jgi:hypothetical protein